jgi:flagellar hook-length control protein FliK
MVQQIAQHTMQQLASAKTDSAAATLPFALSASAMSVSSVQNEARQNFNSEFMRQTQSIRLYEPPRDQAAPVIDSRAESMRGKLPVQQEYRRAQESVSFNAKQVHNDKGYESSIVNKSSDTNSVSDVQRNAVDKGQDTQHNYAEAKREEPKSLGIEDPRRQASYDTNAQTSSDTNAHTSSDTNAQTIRDTNAQTIRDTNAQTSSDTNAQTSSDIDAQTSSDTHAQTSSDMNTQTNSAADVQTSIDENVQARSDTNTGITLQSVINKHSDSFNANAIENIKYEGQIEITVLQDTEQGKLDYSEKATNIALGMLSKADKDFTLPDSKLSADSFDYIDYVTALADFTAIASDLIPAQSEHSGVLKGDQKDVQGEDETIQKNIFMSLNSPLSDTELAVTRAGDQYTAVDKIVDADVIGNQIKILELPITVNASEPLGGEADETFTLTISSEDLQTLHKAKINIQDDKYDLLPSEQAEINTILADLGMQLAAHSENNHGESASVSGESDKALLKTLLLGHVADGNEDEANVSAITLNTSAMNEFVKASDEKGAVSLNAPANTTTMLKSEAVNTNAEITRNGNPVQEKLPQNEVSTAAVPEQTLPNLATDTKKPEAVSASLINLADLNQQESKIALENLTQRMQMVAPQVNGENKGNEFIAALQSGLKEFKQQLAQGREPGIDLKAIVAEALAQVNGESVALQEQMQGNIQQPKIDAVVNQFNAVLQLASAVNSLAAQPQAQALGITDSQLAKEINLGHVEGTKLANGIQNQLNSQASIDKAINIFKQEGQQQLAEKVRWMVNARHATAEIRLDPPDLGGINIKINLSGDIAQVNFNVQSAVAKEALDQAAPRLREMLQDQGIELGQSFVQQDSQGGQQQQASGDEEPITSTLNQNTGITNAQEIVIEGPLLSEQRISNGAIGGIDYYA